MLTPNEWHHHDHMISSPKSEIQFQVQWIYSHLTFQTKVKLCLQFPDGSASTATRTHDLQYTEEHYEQVRQWLRELIDDWRNTPYALAEQLDEQDVHDDGRTA